MPRLQHEQRLILRWGAALAIFAVCGVFFASLVANDLLGSLIEGGIALPIFGTIIVVRLLIGFVAFFSMERPSQTRSFQTLFWRDKWQSDQLTLHQPGSVLAFGVSLLVFKLGILVALVMAALCVFVGAMSLAQAASLLIVGTAFSITYQSIGGCYLLLRQMIGLRADQHA